MGPHILKLGEVCEVGRYLGGPWRTRDGRPIQPLSERDPWNRLLNSPGFALAVGFLVMLLVEWTISWRGMIFFGWLIGLVTGFFSATTSMRNQGHF